jgi:hypothetical protein
MPRLSGAYQFTGTLIRTHVKPACHSVSEKASFPKESILDPPHPSPLPAGRGNLQSTDGRENAPCFSLYAERPALWATHNDLLLPHFRAFLYSRMTLGFG